MAASYHNMAHELLLCDLDSLFAPIFESSEQAVPVFCPPTLPQSTEPEPCCSLTLTDDTKQISSHGFNVKIENSCSGKRQFIETVEGKFLIINKGVHFAAIFSSECPLPIDGYIRAMVHRTTDNNTTSLPPPVVSCQADRTTNDRFSDWFMICSTAGALHHSIDGQHVIDVNITDLISSSNGPPIAVYSFRCQSSHIKKPTCNLTLRFQLFTKSGHIIGNDFMTLKVCSCVARDSKKIRDSTALISETTPPAAKKKRIMKNTLIDPPTPSLKPPSVATPIAMVPLSPPTLPIMDFAKNVKPDKDGYYHFTWRGKDKDVFNLLSIIKKSSEI